MVQTTCFFHADAESPQDVLHSAVFGEVLQSQGDFDPQTSPHIGRRARHPSQLLFPDERVSELPVGVLQLTANRNKPKLVWDPLFSRLPRERRRGIGEVRAVAVVGHLLETATKQLQQGLTDVKSSERTEDYTDVTIVTIVTNRVAQTQCFCLKLCRSRT